MTTTADGRIWTREKDSILSVGFTPEFIDVVHNSFTVLPFTEKTGRILAPKAPMVTLETPEILVTIRSPFPETWLKSINPMCQNFPDRITPDTPVLDLFKVKPEAKPKNKQSIIDEMAHHVAANIVNQNLGAWADIVGPAPQPVEQPADNGDPRMWRETRFASGEGLRPVLGPREGFSHQNPLFSWDEARGGDSALRRWPNRNVVFDNVFSGTEVQRQQAMRRGVSVLHRFDRVRIPPSVYRDAIVYSGQGIPRFYAFYKVNDAFNYQIADSLADQIHQLNAGNRFQFRNIFLVLPTDGAAWRVVPFTTYIQSAENYKRIFIEQWRHHGGVA